MRHNLFLTLVIFCLIFSLAVQWKKKIIPPKTPLTPVKIEYRAIFWSYSASVPSKKDANTWNSLILVNIRMSFISRSGAPKLQDFNFYSAKTGSQNKFKNSDFLIGLCELDFTRYKIFNTYWIHSSSKIIEMNGLVRYGPESIIVCAPLWVRVPYMIITVP